MDEKEKERIKDAALKTLAVVGFIAVLALGAWGTVNLVQLMPRAFSSLASVATSITSIFVPGERIEVSAPESVPSGEQFNLTWNHRRSAGTGTYAFAYGCREGVTAESAGSAISCETPFTITESPIPVTLSSASHRFIDVPLSVTFTAEGQDPLRDEATITVINESIPESPGTTTENGTSTDNGTDGTTTPRTPTPGEREENTYPLPSGGTGSGKPDLAPKLLATGFIDRNSNTFIATSSVAQSQRGAIRFQIENLGTRATGPWTFNAVLPTMPSHIFHSETQQSLAPGDRIEFTLGFDSIANTQNATVIINADPASKIGEASETNNILRATLKVHQ